MKKILLSGLAVFVALALAAPLPATAGAPPNRANLVEILKAAKVTHPQLSVAEAKEMIGFQKGLLVIDVREPAEFRAKHIPGAVNIPRGVLEFKIMSKVKDVDRPVLIYCRTGLRGSLAGQSLKKLGYTNVSNLAGGFVAWEYDGYVKSPLGKKWFEVKN